MRNGPWSAPGIRLAFAVIPRFHETTWFWILGLLGLAVLAFLASRRLVRAVRRREQRRAKEREALLHTEALAAENRRKQAELDGAREIETLNVQLRELELQLKAQHEELRIARREAEIEAALERVRTRAIAMRASDELPDVVNLILHEFLALGFEPLRCFISIIDAQAKTVKIWYPNSIKGYPQTFTVSARGHPIVAARIEATERNEPIVETQVRGEALVDYLNYLYEQTELKAAPPEQKKRFGRLDRMIQTGAPFGGGSLETITTVPLDDEERSLLQRFAKAFDLAYTRFRDLEQAEARAYEATREAAVDRVRGEIATMRTAADLQHITPLIWQELTKLDVPFLRCGVFILDEANRSVEIRLANPRGEALAALNLPFDDVPLIDEALARWRRRQIHIHHWSRQDFLEWMRMLQRRGLIDAPEHYQDAEAPPERLTLQFVPFAQGMLYIGSAEPLPDEHLDTAKALAGAFAVAYARYEDFRRLEAQQAKLLEADRLKSRFFANISHEFRTPLTLVLGLVEDAMQKPDLSLPPVKLSIIRRNARRLLRLINQLLDLARFEAGSMTLHPHRGDVVAFLRQLVLLFSPWAEREDVALTFEADADDIHLDFDPDKLEKVVSNLIHNALKHTPPGGAVGVHVARAVDAGAASVQIVVRDTGPGIDEEERAHVFDRFYRTGRAEEYGAVGAGIGLALCRELVELHGGTIRVERPTGGGSAFIVRLPREQAGSEVAALDWLPGEATGYALPALLDPNAPHEASASDDEPVPDDAPRVLVVEDNPDLARYIGEALAPYYRVEVARDGAEGLTAARVRRPGLILSDVMMPGLDGYALCAAVRADDKLAHVPIILLTARADEESKLEGLGSGADDYIVKPFSMQELLVRVENLIELRQQLRQRFEQKVAIGPSEIEATSEDAAFIRDVQNIVEAHLADANFSVEWLAQEVGLSPRHLRRKLKDLTDLTPTGYISMMRLERAAQLLEQDAGRVSEIAYQVGFTSPDYFSRVFRQAFGLAPSQYPGE